MQSKYPKAFRLSIGLIFLMIMQSLLGLIFHESAYRDVAWIKATWWGNDAVTLLLVVPVMLYGMLNARRGSPRCTLVWLGTLGYAIYNALYYMFGTALNVFLPLYIITLIWAVITLISLVSRLDAQAIAAAFREKTPVKVLGGLLIFIGTGLAAVWMLMWALYIFAGQPTPVEPTAFQVVAAIDCGVIVPLVVIGGVMLWQRKPWGYVIASMGGILGALYLVVLTVNSITAIAFGLADAPGEVPVWATLLLVTGVTTGVLVGHVKRCP